jgi:hypothetical protein
MQCRAKAGTSGEIDRPLGVCRNCHSEFRVTISQETNNYNQLTLNHLRLLLGKSMVTPHTPHTLTLLLTLTAEWFI